MSKDVKVFVLDGETSKYGVSVAQDDIKFPIISLTNGDKPETVLAFPDEEMMDSFIETLLEMKRKSFGEEK